MSAPISTEAAQAKVASGEWSLFDVQAWMDDVAEHQQAEARAAALAVTPHVRKAPASKPGRMSSPRYFNLMRAIENNPDEYADYRPTNYCGAPLTTEDWDKRTALSKAHYAAAVERGVCADCLRLAGTE